MPVIGPLTMILTNVGLSVFNNIQSLKNNDKIRQQQQAFGEAKNKRERERMWENMRSGQKFSEEIEAQLHQQRVEELNTGFERTITRLFYTQNINTWPLNTLPIVLKSGLTVKEDNKIPVLCVFAPSNDKSFNKYIYPQIDMCLASHFDIYYSVNSTHNVLYLSGGWKSGQVPSGAEIDQLKTNLDSIPVLLIYPFFDEKGISFIINIWGMKGQSNAEEMVLQPQEGTFSYPSLKFHDDPDYDDFVVTTTEEFSVFLKAFIGYVADTYYWQLYGDAPLLPRIMELSKYVGTDVYKHDYKELLSSSLTDDSILINDTGRLVNLFDGVIPCLTQSEKNDYVRTNIEKHCLSEKVLPETIADFYGYKDIPFLTVLEENTSEPTIKKNINQGIVLIKEKIPCAYIQYDVLNLDDLFKEALDLQSNHLTAERIELKIEKERAVISLLNEVGEYVYDYQKPGCLIIQFEQLFIPSKVRLESNNLSLSVSQLHDYYTAICNL